MELHVYIISITKRVMNVKVRGCGEGWASATLNRATNRSFENIYMRMNIYMKAAMATNPFLLLLRASVPAAAGTEGGNALNTHRTDRTYC